MMRARDEEGRLLPPPHKRLDNAHRLEQAAVFAISEDARCCHLTMARKLTLVRKAIDHVVDGDAIPKWVSAKDPDFPDNRVLFELFRIAEQAVRNAGRAA